MNKLSLSYQMDELLQSYFSKRKLKISLKALFERWKLFCSIVHLDAPSYEAYSFKKLEIILENMVNLDSSKILKY